MYLFHVGALEVLCVTLLLMVAVLLRRKGGAISGWAWGVVLCAAVAACTTPADVVSLAIGLLACLTCMAFGTRLRFA